MMAPHLSKLLGSPVKGENEKREAWMVPPDGWAEGGVSPPSTETVIATRMMSMHLRIYARSIPRHIEIHGQHKLLT